MVAVKNHHHGVTNPKAQMRFEITIEQVLNAPMVVEPFGLYDCTPQSDGAAACSSSPRSSSTGTPTGRCGCAASGLGLDRVMHQHKDDMTTFPPTVKAAKQAYAMAGIGPADIDVAEVHDCFTGVELINYEDLGFCERWGAAKLIEERETYVGGRIPVNPSGGLKAKGHPPGATGVAQCFELFEQLRGESTNQVDGARDRPRPQHRRPDRGERDHDPQQRQGLTHRRPRRQAAGRQTVMPMVAEVERVARRHLRASEARHQFGQHVGRCDVAVEVVHREVPVRRRRSVIAARVHQVVARRAEHARHAAHVAEVHVVVPRVVVGLASLDRIREHQELLLVRHIDPLVDSDGTVPTTQPPEAKAERRGRRLIGVRSRARGARPGPRGERPGAVGRPVRRARRRAPS